MVKREIPTFYLENIKKKCARDVNVNKKKYGNKSYRTNVFVGWMNWPRTGSTAGFCKPSNVPSASMAVTDIFD